MLKEKPNPIALSNMEKLKLFNCSCTFCYNFPEKGYSSLGYFLTEKEDYSLK